MNREKTVIVVTVAGEQFIAEYDYKTRGDFIDSVTKGFAALREVRRLDVMHVQGKPNELGQVPVHVMYELMNVDPFPGAVPKMNVRLSRWTFLEDCDNPELHSSLDKMLAAADHREVVMRATAAGLSVPDGKGGGYVG